MATASTPRAKAVLAQLRRVLASQTFANSVRISKFLQLVVERTLAGETESLKQFSLGIDVYERRPDYDPSTDSIVRVEAQRLRRKLREYYAGPGSSDPVVISLYPGSYVPVFSRNEKTAAPPLADTRAASSGSDKNARPLDSNTVAVLPFENLSPDADRSLFCEGIAEEIIHRLASMGGLRVLGVTTVAAMRSAPEGLLPTCRRLGVGTLIEGSVRTSGDRLRISAKAVGVGSGRTRWSRRFERRSGDAFHLQDEIAQEVALAMQPPATRSAPQVAAHKPDSAAYILYLKGRQVLDDSIRESCAAAIDFFQQSVALAPSFALPHCGLAQVHHWMAFLGWMRPQEAYPKSRLSALQALRLDPLSADAHVALAQTLLRFEGDWKGAAASASHALELNPSCGLAHSTLANCALLESRFGDAVASFERAMQLDPLSHRTTSALGTGYWFAGKVQEAEHWLRVGLKLSAGSSMGRAFLVRLLLSAGRNQEALELVTTELPSPIDYFLGARGAAYAACGDRESALRVAGELEARSESEYVDRSALVLIYAMLDDWDRTFSSQEKALEECSPIAAFFGVDPLFAPMRSNPRFSSLQTFGMRSRAGNAAE